MIEPFITNEEVARLKKQLENLLADANPSAQSPLSLGDGLRLIEALHQARKAEKAFYNLCDGMHELFEKVRKESRIFDVQRIITND